MTNKTNILLFLLLIPVQIFAQTKFEQSQTKGLVDSIQVLRDSINDMSVRIGTGGGSGTTNVSGQAPLSTTNPTTTPTVILDTTTFSGGWHSLNYLLTIFPQLSGSYSNPTWLSSLAWSKLTGTPTTLGGYNITDGVQSNTAITGATKTKITYDAKGLVLSGADATTADIAASTNKNYVTDAQAIVIGNTSGTNTGDQTTITGNAGSATLLAITNDNATNAVVYPTWVTSTTGNLAHKVSSTGVTFNPSTGILTATGFTGAVTGNASTATSLQNSRTIGGVSFNGTANITVASATGGFTVSGGDFVLGTNNITMTGSIASTGSRVIKGWFTDFESTNVPTVGGVALPTASSSTVFSNKTFTASTNVLGGVTTTFGSDATGDLYYRNVSGILTRLAIGSSTNVLTVSGGLPVWAAAPGGGSGTPGGSGTEFQYRSGASTFGASAVSRQAEGMFNIASLAYNASITAPSASTSTLLTRTIGVSEFPIYLGSGDNLDNVLGPHLGFEDVYTIKAKAGGTPFSSYGWDYTNDFNIVGTVSGETQATTNLQTTKTRQSFTSASTAGSSAEVVEGLGPFRYRSATALGGGFECVWVFGFKTFPTTARCFIGLNQSGSTTSNANPSAMLNCVGLSKDIVETSNFLQLISNDGSGTATKVPTSIVASTSSVYVLIISSKPNTSSVSCSIYEYTTSTTGTSGGAKLTNSFITDLPITNTQLFMHQWVNNGSTASAVSMNIMRWYSKNDL